MDLLPSIADGNLESHSVAELVACAFVSNATGTLVVEQGRTDSRLFLRHGKPCGAQLSTGESSLSDVLIQAGAVDAQTLERTRVLAQSKRVAHGEVLVDEGVLTREQLDHFMMTLQWQHVFSLSLERQGRYELRGWERPPPWSERVALDPLRLLVEVFRTDGLSDRMNAIIERVGDRRVRRSGEFDDLARRLALEEVEAQALRSAGDWMPLDQFGERLSSIDEARNLGIASLLLGLLEVEQTNSSTQSVTGSPWLRPSPEDAVGDQSATGPAKSVTASSLLRPDMSADDELDGFDFDVDGFESDSDAGGFDFDVDAPLELDDTNRGWSSTNVDPFALGSESTLQESAPHAQPHSEPTPDVRSGLSMQESSLLLADAALDAGLEQIARESTSPPSAPPPPLADDDLFSGVEDLVGPLETSESTGPIQLEDSPTVNIRLDDLALTFAQEMMAAEAGTLDADESFLPIDTSADDVSLNAAWEVSEEERSGRSEISEPVNLDHTPSQTQARPDARKRLLQRAFRNVGGDTFRRVTQPISISPGPSATPAPLPAGVELDVELAREVRQRLAGRKEDHFKRLGVARDATTAQIKEAFHVLAKRFHPDTLSASGQLALQPEVEKIFLLVKESYDALVDPATRARYLMELDASAAPASRNVSRHDPAAAASAFGDVKKLLARKSLVAAADLLVRVVELDQKSEYLAELAWTLYGIRKQLDEEIRSLASRARARPPKEIHDHAFVVAAYIARIDGDDASCEKYFRDALKANPNNPTATNEIRLIDSRKKPGWFGLRTEKPAPPKPEKTPPKR